MSHHAPRSTDRSAVRRVGDMGLRRSAVLFLLVLLVGVACGSTSDLANSVATGSDSATGNQTITATPVEGSSDASGETSTNEEYSEGSASRSSGSLDYNIADRITALPPAKTGVPFAAPPGPQPIGLTIEALDINTAGVLGVGVEDNGDMEIPPADRVGWYQFGASPGDERGSAVLAAHIAFDGQDGVFVDLDEIELGSLIKVEYDDGSVVEFVATAKEQYDKNELPKESIFDRSGEPQLVLITCGGDFNREVRSYEDNVVVYADPVDRA